MKQIIYILAASLSLTACGGKKEKEKPLSDFKLKAVAQLVGIARIEPINKIYPLGSETNGALARVYVREGELLKKGQLIMEFNSSLENAQVGQSNSKVGTRNQRIQGFQARIEVIETRIVSAKINMERDAMLAKSEAGTMKQAQDSKAIYDQLVAELKTARADLAETKASVGELQADTRYFQELANKKKIFAPEDGMLLSIDVKPGQTIAPGTKLADFAPSGGLIAITEVDELYAMKVKVGMKVVIRSQGSIDELTTGTIIYTAPFLSKKSIFSDKADNLEDRRVREVRIKIENTEVVLIGSRVECVIKL